MWRRKRGNAPWCAADTGFTLLEVLIAVAFVAFVLVAYMRLHLLSLDATIRAQDLTTAVFLAQSRMNSLDAFPELGEQEGKYEEPELERFHWVTSVTEESLSLGERQLVLRIIRVAIVWIDGQQQRNYILENYGVPEGGTP